MLTFLTPRPSWPPGAPVPGRGAPTLAQMKPLLDAHMAAMASRARNTEVNRARADVLVQCRRKASGGPGVYTLTVPTGGGKTLASLTFAIEHALANGKQRVVYAIPYTSIIEQTADVFRGVFAGLGEDAVIEHHSNAESEPEEENARSRLACENWDAPLVVTTNVQFFESLFARRTSRCRKLHNLVSSVVVLDEAQLLPIDLLQPVVDALALLVQDYGATILLCTATQPVLAQSRSADPGRGSTPRHLRGRHDRNHRRRARPRPRAPARVRASAGESPDTANMARRCRRADSARRGPGHREPPRRRSRVVPSATNARPRCGLLASLGADVSTAPQ